MRLCCMRLNRGEGVGWSWDVCLSARHVRMSLSLLPCLYVSMSLCLCAPMSMRAYAILFHACICNFYICLAGALVFLSVTSLSKAGCLVSCLPFCVWVWFVLKRCCLFYIDHLREVIAILRLRMRLYLCWNLYTGCGKHRPFFGVWHYGHCCACTAIHTKFCKYPCIRANLTLLPCERKHEDGARSGDTHLFCLSHSSMWARS